MQGASPLASPGLGGTRHWVCLWKAGCGGGLAFLVACRPAFSLLCCPPSPKGKDIPPTRARRALFPAGRGRLRLFQARGFAPCIPGAGRGREPAIPAVPIPKEPCGRKIGHKPYGSVNTQYSGKVLGGLGDSFKSPPAFSPAFSPSFPPFPRQRLSDGRGCGSVPAGA